MSLKNYNCSASQPDLLRLGRSIEWREKLAEATVKPWLNHYEKFHK